ncbi:MAG: porin [Noviherbaspirillum sp.]|jgi:predicted porin|nr:porin [Noviherbaspirillum sp.]
MKNKVMAIASLIVLGYVGAAQAQSSVNIYGSIDGGIRHQRNANGVGGAATTMSSTGFNTNNRFGFRGIEDLGNGLNAHFVLENGFTSGTGTFDNTSNKLFSRSAFVGLGGSWGAVDLGRQFSVNFKTIGAYDPFNYNYPSLIPLAASAFGNSPIVVSNAINPTGTLGGYRFDNDIQYTGTFGPVTVRGEYVLGEVAGSTRNGSAQAIGATYSDGPLSFGGAYGQKTATFTASGPGLPGTVPAGSYQDGKQWTAGGAYRFGNFRVAGGYIKETQENGSALREAHVKNSWAGLSYNFNPALKLTGAFYRTKVGFIGGAEGKRDLWIVGAGYALSKRTSLYGEIDQIRLSGAILGAPGLAGARILQNGLSVGMTHQF